MYYHGLHFLTLLVISIMHDEIHFSQIHKIPPLSSFFGSPLTKKNISKRIKGYLKEEDELDLVIYGNVSSY